MFENEGFESQSDVGQEDVVDSQEGLGVENEVGVDGDEQNAIEEVVEPQKPIQSAEDNAKYATIRREAEERARSRAQAEYDKQIADLYGDHGIKSFAELKQAIEKQKEEERLDELLSNNIPEEYAKEIIENRKFREQFQSEKQQQEQKQKETQMFSEFMEMFPNVKGDEIPAEVWQMVDSGKSLTDAFALHQVKNMDQFKIQAQQEAIKAIKDNADSSTGSVNAGAAGEQSSMSVDQVNQLLANMSNSEQSKWIDSNMQNLEKWGYFKKY